jgi:hypothetical protein
MPWEETDERAQSEKAEEKEGQTYQVMRIVSGSIYQIQAGHVIPVRTLEKANATNVVATISRCMPSPISWAMRVAIM